MLNDKVVMVLRAEVISPPFFYPEHATKKLLFHEKVVIITPDARNIQSESHESPLWSSIFAELISTLGLQSEISDPLPFFGIRRDFAETFRRAVGCGGSEHEKCSSADGCSFEKVFSQEMSTDPFAAKRFRKPPLPFVSDPPILPYPPNMGKRVILLRIGDESSQAHVGDGLLLLLHGT